MRAECVPVWIEVNRDGVANALALNTSFAVGRGGSVELALEHLRGDVEGTRKWLAAHGIHQATIEDRRFRIVQTVETTANPLRGESRAFFDWDAQFPSDDQIDAVEHVLHCSRADLLNLLAHAPEESLDIRLAPRTRTIREIARHVAARELWFAACLLDDPLDAPMVHEFGSDVCRRLHDTRLYFREHCLNCLRRAYAAQRTRQQLHERELWSGRKALRSAVQHELYHLKQVYGMLRRIQRLPADVRRAAVA